MASNSQETTTNDWRFWRYVNYLRSFTSASARRDGNEESARYPILDQYGRSSDPEPTYDEVLQLLEDITRNSEEQFDKHRDVIRHERQSAAAAAAKKHGEDMKSVLEQLRVTERNLDKSLQYQQAVAEQNEKLKEEIARSTHRESQVTDRELRQDLRKLADDMQSWAHVTLIGAAHGKFVLENKGSTQNLRS